MGTVSRAAGPRQSRRRRRARHGSAKKLTLFHISPARYRRSIDRSGLLPEKATGKEQSVWLVTRTMIPWALAHTATKRGKAAIPKLLVYRVETTRAKVRRFRRGIWRAFEPLQRIGCKPASAYTPPYPGEPEPDWDWLAAEAAALDSVSAGYFRG
jgi:hypothetical protein